jgi:hypothetical protein
MRQRLMKLDKSRTIIKGLKDKDSGYVNASPEDRVSFSACSVVNS